MTEVYAVIIWQGYVIEYIGTIFQLKRTWGLAPEHIRRHTILQASIILRERLNACNDIMSRQLEIAGPEDLISRLRTWLGNILFDVDTI